MINCNECSEMISEDARNCPKCGSKQFEGISLTNIFLSLINGVIVWSLILFLGGLTNKNFVDDYEIIIDLIGIVVVLSSIYMRYNKRIFTGTIVK